MKGFAYFESWLIEGRQGILEELAEEFREVDAMSRELQMERGRRLELEAELQKWKPTNSGGNNLTAGRVGAVGGGGEGAAGDLEGVNVGVQKRGNGRKKSAGGGKVSPRPGPSSSVTKRGGQVKHVVVVKQLEGNGQDPGNNIPLNLSGARRKLEPEVKDGATSKKKLKSTGRSLTPAKAVVATPPLPMPTAPVVGTQRAPTQIKRGSRPSGSKASKKAGPSPPKPLNMTDILDVAKRMTATPTKGGAKRGTVGKGSSRGSSQAESIISGGEVSWTTTSTSSQSQQSISMTSQGPVIPVDSSKAPKGLEQLWTLITESCLPGSEAATRKSSLQRLAKVTVPQAHQQKLVRLICGCVTRAQGEDGTDGTCSQLSHSFRLLESLFSNLSMDLEDHAVYIRETIEGSFSTILKNLFLQPTSETDWELLNLTARLVGKAVKLSKMDEDRAEVTELFQFRLDQVLESWTQGKDLSLVCLYHIIFTVKEIGKKEIKTLILRNIPVIGERLQKAEESWFEPEFPEVDKMAIRKIQSLIVEIASPILVSTRKLPDPLEGYVKDFGNYFGERLFVGVQKLRAQKQAGRQKRRTQMTQSASKTN